MEKQTILLKEYETCQQHIKIVESHYWLLFAVFMPINTALLAAVPYTMFHFSKAHWLILVLGLAIIAILLCLKLYFKRVCALTVVDYFRMREIETELGMLKNLYVYELDHWREAKLDNETRKRIKPLKAEHMGNKGEEAIGMVLWIFIVLWGLAIILAFIAPCIGIVESSG